MFLLLGGVVDRRALGRIGEDAAIRALRRRGYRIVARNVRCPMGELDLVAEHDGHIVFLEVKTRTGNEFGVPAEAISPTKQRRLTRLATFYLTVRRLLDRPCRFDAVAVLVTLDGRVVDIDLVRDAFEAVPR
jgi:putative endonuclease